MTLDGTAQRPYRVPAQADDGTIVASHLDEIVRMRQNGEVIGTIDPAPLSNSVGHPVDGPPVNLAVSPDGSRIAYSLVGYECPVGADRMARSVTAFTAADSLAPASQWGALHRRNCRARGRTVVAADVPRRAGSRVSVGVMAGARTSTAGTEGVGAGGRRVNAGRGRRAGSLPALTARCAVNAGRRAATTARPALTGDT